MILMMHGKRFFQLENGQFWSDFHEIKTKNLILICCNFLDLKVFSPKIFFHSLQLNDISISAILVHSTQTEHLTGVNCSCQGHQSHIKTYSVTRSNLIHRRFKFISLMIERGFNQIAPFIKMKKEQIRFFIGALFMHYSTVDSSS